MIVIKNRSALAKMQEAGKRLQSVLSGVRGVIRPGVNALELENLIAQGLSKQGLESSTKGYRGYRHVSCISLNDEVVHGVPTVAKVLREGDLLKIDICASWRGYCADMARSFFIGKVDRTVQRLVETAWRALDRGIQQAYSGNHLTDISAAIQSEIEAEGFGIVRDFAGHGIGKRMHEDPEVFNYGVPGKGPIIRSGMAFAIEPMITMGSHEVYITDDGWTVKTCDGSMAAHVEDTVIVTDNGPVVITRFEDEKV